MSRSGALVTVSSDRLAFTCHVCRGNIFGEREVKINTTGAEFFNMGWANQSATGLVCFRCGYLHIFVSDVEFWEPEGGYPAI